MLKVILRAVATSAVIGAQFANAQPAKKIPSSAIGTSFTYTFTSDVRDTSEAKWWNGIATVRMLNGTVRMDYSKGTALVCCSILNRPIFMNTYDPWPATAGNSYLLMNSTASWYIAFVSGRHFYLSYDARDFAVALDRGGASVNPVFTTGTFAFVDLGVGENILGYATRHVRIATRYKVGTNSGTEWLDEHADTTDLWLAFNTGIDENSLVSWAETFGTATYFSNPLLAEQRRTYLREFGCKAFPLRMITRMSLPSINRDTGTTVRVDVTELKAAPLDTLLFQVPKSYSRLNGNDLPDTFPKSQHLPPRASRFCR